MSLKGQKTTADYLEWEALKLLILKLQRDYEFKFCLFISIGSFCGLRISDLLQLKWSDLMLNEIPNDSITITESKTSKSRTIKLNNDLQKLIKNCYTNLKEQFEEEESKKKKILKKQYIQPKPFKDSSCFVNKEGAVFTRQYVNQKLKIIMHWYDLPIKNFSSHSLRKTFGREVWNRSHYSDKALSLLSEIFDHSNMQITRRYLGINDDEIENAYDLLTL
jgi:integrase